jgi:hypothetical protein
MQKFRFIEQRTKFLCAKLLETTEKEFGGSPGWRQVRCDILGLTNDVIRANRKDLDMFDNSYKVYPFVLSCNLSGKKTLSLPNAALDILQNMEFYVDPYKLIIRAKSNDYSVEVMTHLMKVLTFGELKYEKGDALYIIHTDDCVKAISVLDLIPLKQSVKSAYEEWKEKLDRWYFAYGER